MTDEEIVERAKEAEKRTYFGELVHSPISKGVNSAFGIGFIEGMVEYRNSLQEEPVSENLEEASRNYADNEEYGDDVCFAIKAAFKAGAKWQKAKDQETIELAEDHAMLAGMEKMKEEMMAKAIDGTLLGGHLIKQEGITHPLHRGDKVKMILIKED